MSTHTEEAIERRAANETRADRQASFFVWGVLVAMTIVVLAHIARYGRNIPLSEDWNMVPALTGEETDFWSWVWSQNNEHRLPVAKLIYLGLLQLTRDFRSGMVFDTLLMAALAAGLILLARRLRGRTSVLDAFFPVVLLHLGNWENLLWSWQIQFVLVTAVTGALLLMFVGVEVPPPPKTTLLLGVALAFLPLGGGTALPMVPAAIAALFAIVWLPRASKRSRHIALGASGLTVVLVGAYFVSWQAATWYPDNPGAIPTLRTATKVLALGLGPAAKESFTLATLAVAGVLASAVVLLLGGLRRGGEQRRRAMALSCLLGGTVLTALVIGYGRAGLVPTEGLPDRYVAVTVPALLAAWFAWELFGPAGARRLVQAGLLVLVVMLIPINTTRGYSWRDYYSEGMDEVEADIRAGTSLEVMVEDHGDFLMHWNADLLAARMAMLQRARIGPFAELCVEPCRP